jgi:hypothetical protein
MFLIIYNVPSNVLKNYECTDEEVNMLAQMIDKVTVSVFNAKNSNFTRFLQTKIIQIPCKYSYIMILQE